MRSEATALLPALVVACLLCPWGAEGASVPQRPCSLPRGYRRFHANDSLIGRPVPCNSDDKICFRHNLLFDPQVQRCGPVGGRSRLQPNRTEFEHGSGRLVGEYKVFADPCPGYRMAYDSRCYKKDVVDDVICTRCAHITRHLLGGVECRDTPATPISVQQPEEDGRCLIPDLRYPDIKRSKFFEIPSTAFYYFRGDENGIKYPNSSKFQCEAKQADCFDEEKVWVSEFEGCYKLLEAGPCPAEQVVALNSSAAQQGRAEGTCVPARGGCPRGHTRMLFDGQCHEDREFAIEAPGVAVGDPYGQYVVIPRGYVVMLAPLKGKPGTCYIYVRASGSTVTEAELPKPPCGSDDSGYCRLFEVEAERPLPEDD